MIAIQNHFLSLMGKVSSTVMKKMGLPKPQTNSFWAFVDYASQSYRIGSQFDFITDGKSKWNNDLSLQIREIRDQFGNKHSSLSKGWQTICLFECSPEVPDIIKTLPEIAHWESNDHEINIFQESKTSVSSIDPIKAKLIEGYGYYIIHELKSQNRNHLKEAEIEGVFKKLPNTLPLTTNSRKEYLRLVVRRMKSKGLLREKNGELEVV
jgi:hypothetical protein